MTAVSDRIECKWCHAHSPLGMSSCDRCGAPLDARERVSDAGWRQAPRLRDLTEIRFGTGSSAQVDLGVVPVAEISLHPADSVFFEHHAMLWKDESVPMSVMSSPGGARRLLGDVPFVLSVAHGPGRLAFSRDAAGELVVLPIEPGVQLELRGHALLLASSTLTFSFTKLPGLKTMLMAGTGMYLDQFIAPAAPGVVIVHGFGNVFQRALGAGETIHLDPGAFLYKDSSVTMTIDTVEFGPQPSGGAAQGLHAAKQMAGKSFRGLKAMRQMMSEGGLAGAAEQLMGGGGGALAEALSSNTAMSMLRMTGPGRVGMQSMDQPRVTD